MSDEQLTKIFATICRSLDDVEQGRSSIEHITYGLIRKKGDTEETMHIIIIRTPKTEEERNENEEQH